MGVFAKSKSESQRMLSSSKKKKVGILKLTGTSSTEDDLPSYSPRHNSRKNAKHKVNTAKKASKFVRLQEDNIEDVVMEYVPPPGFIPPPAEKQLDSAAKTHHYHTQGSAKKKKKQTKAFQRLKNVDSSFSESGNSTALPEAEYEPPSFPIAQQTNMKATFSIQKSPQLSNNKNEKFQSFMQDVIRHSSSEETFDVGSQSSFSVAKMNNHAKNDIFSPTRVTSEPSPSGLFSESGFPTSSGGHDFQQFVFGDNFNTIKKVAVAKSDAGGSDFSDFVQAAAHLTKVFSPEASQRPPASESKTDTKSDTKRPSANDDKTKRQPSNSKNVVLSPDKSRATSIAAPGRRSNKPDPKYNAAKSVSSARSSRAELEWPETDDFLVASAIAPSSLPPRRIKQATTKVESSNSSQWQNFDQMCEESLQESFDDGFSVSSYQTTGSKKSRQEFQVAIRAKPHTPASQRKEPLRRPNKKNSRTASDQSMTDISNISSANATFANPSAREDVLSSNKSFLRTGFNTERTDEIDLFHIGDPTEKYSVSFHDENPFRIGESETNEDTAWDANKEPFQNNNSKHTRQDVIQATSMDDGLIASIRKASSKVTSSVDPDGESYRPEPSPREVKPSCSDSILEYATNNLMTQKHGPQKTPPKAVPTNAILGSMLFRQTQASQRPEQNTKTVKPVVKQKEKSSAEKDEDLRSEQGSFIIPRSVHADDTDASIVSSVTEEASSFYQKTFGNQWSKQAQNVLNQYHVNHIKKKTFKSPNTASRHNKYGRGRAHETLTSLEEEHATMFRSDC